MFSRQLSFFSAVSLTTVITVLFHGAWVAAQPVVEAPKEAIATLNWFQGIVLGFIQGLTEFLPISSTAHLKIIPLALVGVIQGLPILRLSNWEVLRR